MSLCPIRHIMVHVMGQFIGHIIWHIMAHFIGHIIVKPKSKVRAQVQSPSPNPSQGTWGDTIITWDTHPTFNYEGVL